MFEVIGTLEASSPAKGLAKTAASVHIEGTQKVMFADNRLSQLEAIARRAAEPQGVEVAWVELEPQGRGWVFRVFIERIQNGGDVGEVGGGVGLEDCQRVGERLSLLLDVEDPIEWSYTLEVSSPGLDRPLHEPKDYERFVGELARIKTKRAMGGRRRFVGRLVSVEPIEHTEDADVPRNDSAILLQEEAGQIRIPYSAIESARLEVNIHQPSPRKARKRA